MPKTIAHKISGKSAGELEADQFRAGDVWESPRGVRYTPRYDARSEADLVNETTHRTANRAYDDLGWGHSGRPWVRISSGTKDKS